MASINKEVIIDAPLEELFTYISKPSNLLEIWPSLMQVKNEQILPNGGYSFDWVYKMSGVYLEGAGEYTDVTPHQWLTAVTRGAISSKITWTFREKDNHTRVTFTVEYRTPLPLLNRLVESIIAKMNDQEADLIMANLQARFM